MSFAIRLLRSYRTQLITLSAAIVLLLAAACGGADEGSSVTGTVIAVDPRSLTEFKSMTLVDSDRKEWQFKGGAFAGFTPSHLLEHMALGESVTVWYVDDGVDLTVTLIEDG